MQFAPSFGKFDYLKNYLKQRILRGSARNTAYMVIRYTLNNDLTRSITTRVEWMGRQKVREHTVRVGKGMKES